MARPFDIASLDAFFYGSVDWNAARRQRARNTASLPVASLLFLSAVSASAATWLASPHRPESNGELCEALAIQLGNVGQRCAADGLETFAKFFALPWESIDPATHLDLVTKLIAYSSSGAKAYFDGMKDLEKARVGANEFISNGGELRVWRPSGMAQTENPLNSLLTDESQSVILLIRRLRSWTRILIVPAQSPGVGVMRRLSYSKTLVGRILELARALPLFYLLTGQCFIETKPFLSQVLVWCIRNQNLSTQHKSWSKT